MQSLNYSKNNKAGANPTIVSTSNGGDVKINNATINLARFEK
jgi:hypothetical protein